MLDKFGIFLLVVALGYTQAVTYDKLKGEPNGAQLFETEGKNCTKPGLMCESCTKVAFCIEISENVFEKELLDDCPSGLTCAASTGQCTSQPDANCDANVQDYKFVCYQTGIYPDPFDCFKYHICVPSTPESRAVKKESIPLKCTNGHSYDPLTSLCRLALVNGTCAAISTPCKVSGQVAAIARNPAIYSLCFPSAGKIFPQMLLCPADKFHNGVECVKRTPTAAVGSDGLCLAVGQFSDPKNCRSYLECLTVGKIPTKKECAAGSQFDMATKKCALFACPKIN